MQDNKDHLRALLAAYNAATGLDLSFSPARERILRCVDKAGVTPADVGAVMEELKRLRKIGKEPYHLDAILTFESAIANVDRLENRAKLLRQKRQPKPAAKKSPQNAPAPAPIDETRRMAEQLREFRAGGLKS